MTYYGVCIANSLRSLDRLSAPRPRSNGAGHRVLGNGAGRGIRAGPRVLAGPRRPVTNTNQVSLPETNVPLSDYIKHFYRREFSSTLGPEVGSWHVTIFHTLRVPVYRLGLGDES